MSCGRAGSASTSMSTSAASHGSRRPRSWPRTSNTCSAVGADPKRSTSYPGPDPTTDPACPMQARQPTPRDAAARACSSARGVAGCRGAGPPGRRGRPDLAPAGRTVRSGQTCPAGWHRHRGRAGGRARLSPARAGGSPGRLPGAGGGADQCPAAARRGAERRRDRRLPPSPRRLDRDGDCGRRLGSAGGGGCAGGPGQGRGGPAGGNTLGRHLGGPREAVAAQQMERAGAAESTRAVGAAESSRAAAEAEARRLRSRLAGLEEALEGARRADREGRGLGTIRLGLLLDTLTEAAAGLRRELALPASSLRPADTVDALEPGESAGSGRPRDDPALLDDLLALPRAHLVVDGYNVTKSVWQSMPLEAQRTRLVQGLAALVARTGAEVTCVFDGADVSVPPAMIPGQGVRVRFSARGQTADDLILRMVAAEPSGRPVIVVSSDREVADGVRRQGARALETPALVGLLAGGATPARRHPLPGRP